MQQFQRSFDAFGREHTMRATVLPNDDPVASGSTVILPMYKPAEFLGFPMIKATVKSDHVGFGSMFGWVQFVECTSNGNNSSDTTTTDGTADGAPTGDGRDIQNSGSNEGWQLDTVPLFEDMDSPFIYFGSDPTLFDAPVRVGVDDLKWRAQSYLTNIADSVITKEVAPILGFTWGFDVKDGIKTIVKLEELDLKASWNDRLSGLRGKFANWTFKAAQ